MAVVRTIIEIPVVVTASKPLCTASRNRSGTVAAVICQATALLISYKDFFYRDRQSHVDTGREIDREGVIITPHERERERERERVSNHTHTYLRST